LERKNTSTENLARPNPKLRGLLNQLEVRQDREKLQDRTAEHLKSLVQQGGLGSSALYPSLPEEDKLFNASYRHKHRDDTRCDVCRRCQGSIDPVCEEAPKMPCTTLRCDESMVIRRAQRGRPVTQNQNQSHGPNESVSRRPGHPVVHFGLYASGDMVMKSGEKRDNVAKAEKVIAFEMEPIPLLLSDQGAPL
jgi:hypothetical protein